MPDAVVTHVSQTFTIGELASEFDLTTRAIRFYEDCGLLGPQRHGRNRVYTARDRTRLKLTLRGKRLGLTLAEVKELVDMYESPRDTQAQLKKFMLVLADHRGQLEQQMADLHATLDEVRAHEREARRLLNASDRSQEKARDKAVGKAAGKAAGKTAGKTPEKAADKRSAVSR